MPVLLTPVVWRGKLSMIRMLDRLFEQPQRWVGVRFEEHFCELILEFLLHVQPVALIPAPYIGFIGDIGAPRLLL